MPDSEALSCVQARRLSELAGQGPLPRPVALALVTHRGDCEDCAAIPVDIVASPRSTPPAPKPVSVRVRRRRALALRFALVSAVIFAASRLFGDFKKDPTLAVEALSAGVFVGGESLHPGAAVTRAWRGDLIETGPGARASLHLRNLFVEQGPEAELLVESVLGTRLRLLYGEFEITGSGRLSTPFGNLELEGVEARVALDGAATRVSLGKGHARWTNALGSLELAAGQSLAARPGFARLEAP